MVGTIATEGLSDRPLFPLDGAAKFLLSLLAPYVGAVFLETFLFGLYTILFGICLYVLLRAHKSLHLVLLAFAVLMYALAAADVGYTYFLVFGKLMGGVKVGDLTEKALYPKYVLFVTNGVLADTLLMYRCFVVWGRKKRVIFGPFLLLIATTVCGYLFEGAAASLFRHAWVYLAMTFALNVILTILTAGRIWHLRHRTRRLLGEGLLQRYNATLAILIESGVLYSTYMVLDLAFQNDPVASVILDAGLIQVVGIMPTLIIVQVGLGRAMHDMHQDTNANGTTTSALTGRIEANKASLRLSLVPPPSPGTKTPVGAGEGGKFVAVPNGHGGYGYYGPGYFRSSLIDRDGGDGDGEESRRSSKVLMDEDEGVYHHYSGVYAAGDGESIGEFNPYAMRSMSDATTTVDSRSELVLHISKENMVKEREREAAARSRGSGVTTTTISASNPSSAPAATRAGAESRLGGVISRVPQVLRVDTWASSGAFSTPLHSHKKLDSTSDTTSFTPAPQRRTRSRKSSSGARSQRTSYTSNPMPGSHHRAGSSRDSDDDANFSTSKRTLVTDADQPAPPSPSLSEIYPRPYHSLNTRSPTVTSPLSAHPPLTSSGSYPALPGQARQQQHRRLQSATPPPPGIALPSPPSLPSPRSGVPGTPTGTALVSHASPLSRLVKDIARPQQVATGGGAGYFDASAAPSSSLAAPWAQPPSRQWPGGVGERERAPSSLFPVPVSVAPSRASSADGSCYSPV